MHTEAITGDQVRIPDATVGTATAIQRYGKARAYLLHPDDFHRLSALDALVTSALVLDPITFSEAAARAHADESTATGSAITDPQLLDTLFAQ